MRALLLSISMFTVAPIRSPGSVDRTSAGGALRWLPFVGAVVGALAGCAALAFWRGGGKQALLGAVVMVAMPAIATRGLHLDGLADLADGLGSRAPAATALAVMRQSDIGPFGVITLTLTLLVEVAAWSTLLAGAAERGSIVAQGAIAAGVGRTAVLFAAGPEFPAAEGSSFGTLVTGTAGWPARIASDSGLFAIGGLAEWVAGTSGAGLGGSAGAAVIALAGAYGLARHAKRRLGGVSGDVFGAIVEGSTATYLLVLAAVVSWHGSL
jgi:adenosylcobinamide-GDP ribazoletransferase